MALADVVMNTKARYLRSEPSARLFHSEKVADGFAQSPGSLVRSTERDLRHRVAQDAGSNRVALGMVGIEEALRRCLLNHLRQLPTEIHCILHSDVEALSTQRGMHVCGIARQQHPSVPVGRGLPRQVSKSRDPGRTVNPVVGSVNGNERLTDVVQRRPTVES